MISQRLTSPILLAAICGGVLVCAAADFRLGTSQGVLLLRNGSVLRGEIAHQGDHYVVSFGDSGRARVQAADIERVCGDLEEAYRYKLSQIDGSLASRAELARWCLQQDLLPRAADQILAAEVEHGKSPQLEAVHQRLMLAAKPQQQVPDNTDKQATRSGPGEQAELLQNLAPGIMERFTSAVQPLLLNRCTNAGCHGQRAGTSLVLIRPLAGRSLTRRLTEQNLASTLRQLDRQQPLDSPLLRKARVSHGGAKSAALTDHHAEQFELLAEWVRSVSANARPTKPNTIVEPNEILLQAPVNSVSTPGVWSDAQTSSSSPSPSSPPDAKRDYQPVDPFDPEMFNRRYHPSRGTRAP